MNINFEWKRETNPPFPGLKYRVGKLTWPIGSVHLKVKGVDPENDPRRFECWVNLPGMRVNVSRHFTEEAGKQEVEKTIDRWFEMVLHDKLVIDNRNDE